jgi:hypothetical protein
LIRRTLVGKTIFLDLAEPQCTAIAAPIPPWNKRRVKVVVVKPHTDRNPMISHPASPLPITRELKEGNTHYDLSALWPLCVAPFCFPLGIVFVETKEPISLTCDDEFIADSPSPLSLSPTFDPTSPTYNIGTLPPTDDDDDTPPPYEPLTYAPGTSPQPPAYTPVTPPSSPVADYAPSAYEIAMRSMLKSMGMVLPELPSLDSPFPMLQSLPHMSAYDDEAGVVG